MKTKTPLTDDVVRPYIGMDHVSAEEASALLDHARKMEEQRTELLEAAEQMLRAYPEVLGGTGQATARDRLRAAVDSATTR